MVTKEKAPYLVMEDVCIGRDYFQGYITVKVTDYNFFEGDRETPADSEAIYILYTRVNGRLQEISNDSPLYEDDDLVDLIYRQCAKKKMMEI